MLNHCAQCARQFEITDEDLKFYDMVSPVFAGKKYAIPAPTLCPPCRAQRRLAFRNERRLYNRKCDLSGRQILSSFSPDKPYTVYESKEWWSDKWDATSFGRDFDFSRPFFGQFEELWLKVPQQNLKGENNENSDYCNLTANCKNCYLIFESSNNEDCLYGYWLQKCTDCSDTAFSHECQGTYQINNCYNCYNLLWSQNCTGCSDAAFLYDCIACSDCLFCVSQRNKKYCIFNKQYTKEKYDEEAKKYLDGSYRTLERSKQEFRHMVLQFPHRYAQFVNAENCTGDYIQNSKNCRDCFHAHDAEDCRYGEHVWRDSRWNMDVSTVGRGAELCYESINTATGAYHDLFCIQCWSETSDLIYCNSCFSSKNCFGCIGLRHKQYCILNKQYSREDYEIIVPKIISHMEKTKEWGEFFPVSISEYSYNETVAQEQFPRSKASAQKLGAKWKDDDSINAYQGKTPLIPDNINHVDDGVTKEILTCGSCKKNYKIIPQELAFYRKKNLPLPRLCPDCRHKERMLQRNENRLYQRVCAKCKTPVQTTYSPDRPEIIYCETCYLKEVY